ncbi:MAG: c-type cytochrome [Chitinophagaceae bacterium]|nr:c-type cytochrome [Chitinophagaceae bacterium]
MIHSINFFRKISKRKLTGLTATIMLSLLFSISCNSPAKDASDEKTLSEEEKHQPENALRGLKWPDDLDITLFAHEPMLVNPTNMDIDENGRVWVCEGYNYRYTLHRDNPYDKAGDRIVIMEDTDGDGKADKQTVFYQGEDINSALGIAVLGNKVIISRSPDVFLFTDENGDGVADKKDTLFTGIGGTEHDHAIHAFNFGPDGKLYFNFGNVGDSLKDKNGKLLKDIYGNDITSGGNPWRQGMTFRCDMEGKNIEVLGNNFRNPYEVTEDSYGTLWQSDNDDDGNRGVRINYVMQYGNFGYRDEMTGASWPERRINLEDSIPFRHWHLNDPGVVPNMLQTGAGSPTGILVYEGVLLPERFRNQLIHTDAGPNVARSYAVSDDGAGYKATINNIAEGTSDNWFRPSDVCVAPDGSVMIADWYDPGVGGHNIGDFKKGRIFRVTPAGQTKYTIPSIDLSDADGAVTALKSPNRSTRYLAWQKLHSMGGDAAAALEKLYHSDNSRYRARALWLLSKMPGKGFAYVLEAIKDKDPNIRITALRAGLQINADTVALVQALVNDNNIQVKREAALALHHNHSAGAAALWAQLAKQYDGNDRWYLEALGIGADRKWDTFLPAWLQLVNNDWNNAAGKDIIWRARTAIALPMLVNIISDPDTDPHGQLKFFRAFDFYKGPEKQKALFSLLAAGHPQQDYIDAITILQLDSKTPQTGLLKKAIDNGLKNTEGTHTYIDIVRKYGIKNKNREFLAMAAKSDDKDTQTDAIRLVLESGGTSVVRNILFGSDTADAKRMAGLLAGTDNDNAKTLLLQFITDTGVNSGLRIAAVKQLATGWRGETALLELVKNKKLPEDLRATATDIFSKTSRKNLRKEAAKYLTLADQTGTLPPISQMLAVKGNADSGALVFTTYCGVCHQVNGKGIEFGPDLSEIGTKLPPEALYTAIIKPSEGISFGFEGYTFKLKNGAELTGYIISETEDGIGIRMIGGTTEKYKKAEIAGRTAMQQSLMPEGLAEGMGATQLENLVAYLSQLKKK